MIQYQHSLRNRRWIYGRSFRILIVDDDPDIRKFCIILLKINYFVAQAADGAAAVTISRPSETDLIVLDVMMPGMSGYDTCDRLRKLSNAPVLYLTARSGEQDMLSAYLSAETFSFKALFSQKSFSRRSAPCCAAIRNIRAKATVLR